ncbi:MAG: glycosyltransferase family 2 protein [Parachlamydiaceae bacterium]|nr:glycosyltransferase family 2 protein [Parachlamydiaceae bacterium]
MLRTVILCVLVIVTAPIYAELEKTVAIVTYFVQGMKPWDPDSIQKGMTGSEEAVIYMSQALAKQGYKVYVLGYPPENSRHSLPEANPQFVSVDYKHDKPFDVAISWRMPDIADKLKLQAHKVYFWPHDTYHWQLTPAQIDGFSDVLWISHWQRAQWISVNPGFAKFTHIFGNGIDPTQFAPVKERTNPYSCIYASNYARGLEVLLEIWPKVHQAYPKATLDLYYGWQHWGLISPEKESKMRAQLANIAPMGVTDHGMVSHAELNQAFANASFWTYPCIAPETFCITGLRAQLAGAMPVIIEGSALSETVPQSIKCSSPDQYLGTLLAAFSNAHKITLQDRAKLGEFILKDYTWDVLAQKWKALFEKSGTDEEIVLAQPNKTVFVAVLARNKDHVLPKFFKCLENLDYDKKLMTIYINTNNNSDDTLKVIANWIAKNKEHYKDVILENKDVAEVMSTNPHDWAPTRFKILANIRNRSLEKAKESKADYYFVVDCDNFIVPSTLKDLVHKDRPIIAPLLRSIPEPCDRYANFFCDATESGYYKDHPNYEYIINRSMVGTFKVPVVHCTYLINSKHLDKLNYVDDTDDYEFVIFSRKARENGIDQYICNEKEYGVQLHFHTNLTLDEEKRRVIPFLTIP